MPKEIFELDKDERWQARLDEARARREVALREKAAGKAQKPRPKPWEVDGAAIEKPPEIDPIIQERGDDKFDFADRLETIRETKAATPAPCDTVAASAPRPAAPEVVPDPPPVEARPEPTPLPPRSLAPEARARPQPSLVLPGAPDVAELAARYAATLDRSVPELVEDGPDRPTKTAELVALPTAARPVTAQAPQAERRLTRAERRRGIRPLGMAFGLLAFAVLPLTTEAPPLETGPDMPVVDVLRIQPALGVTWSLSEQPRLTRSGEWVPQGAPSPLAGVPFGQSVDLRSSVAALPEPVTGGVAPIDWSSLAPVAQAEVPGLSAPTATVEPVPGTVAEPVAPPAAVAAPTDVEVPTPPSDISAPPRPDTLRDEAGQPPPPPPPPSVRPEPVPDTVVEADPLRVTILAPVRSDRALAETIASGVQNDGHELVRVRDVSFAISERNVRYFHEADRASAARMAERYDAELRDFTWFRPRPLEGTAELWLAGRAPGSNTSGRTQPSAAAAPANQGEFLDRVFDRLGLGTELPDALPSARDLRSVLPGLGGSGN